MGGPMPPRELLVNKRVLQVRQDAGAAGLDDDGGAEGEAEVVAAADREGVHLSGGEVEGLLRAGDACRGTEGDGEDEPVAVGDAAVCAAGVVGGGKPLRIDEEVVEAAALHICRGEAGSEFDAAHSRNRKNQMGDEGLYRVEERLSESCRDIVAYAAYRAAERVTGLARLLQLQPHRFGSRLYVRED